MADVRPDDVPADEFKTVITPISLLNVAPVHRLFVQAVRRNFTYFPEQAQAKVIRDHRPLKLLLAKLNPRRIILTAYYGDDLVGYVIGAVPRDAHGQIYWLYVDDSRRGKNTGLALLSRMIRYQRSLGASEVTLATHDHRRYYERQGFIWTESREVDGVRMDIMTFRIMA